MAKMAMSLKSDGTITKSSLCLFFVFLEELAKTFDNF